MQKITPQCKISHLNARCLFKFLRNIPNNNLILRKIQHIVHIIKVIQGYIMYLMSKFVWFNFFITNLKSFSDNKFKFFSSEKNFRPTNLKIIL